MFKNVSNSERYGCDIASNLKKYFLSTYLNKYFVIISEFIVFMWFQYVPPDIFIFLENCNCKICHDWNVTSGLPLQ